MIKQPHRLAPLYVFLIALAFALLAAGAVPVYARADDEQGASSHNMRLVGTNDLQARSTYQPTLHKYPNNRYILFAGHHALVLQGEGMLPNAQPLPSFNSRTNRNEENGTSIVDVSNTRRPQYLFHLPVPNGQGGGAQMVRVCDGSTLPIHNNKIYLLRTYASSAHEIWDVSNPANPVGSALSPEATLSLEPISGCQGPSLEPIRAGGNATPGSHTSSADAAMTQQMDGGRATTSSSSI